MAVEDDKQHKRLVGFITGHQQLSKEGAQALLQDELPAYMARVRAKTDVPLTIGFGISTPDHVRAASQLADGVVVASALIDHLDTLPLEEQAAAARKFVRAMADATGRD